VYYPFFLHFLCALCTHVAPFACRTYARRSIAFTWYCKLLLAKINYK